MSGDGENTGVYMNLPSYKITIERLMKGYLVSYPDVEGNTVKCACGSLSEVLDSLCEELEFDYSDIIEALNEE